MMDQRQLAFVPQARLGEPVVRPLERLLVSPPRRPLPVRKRFGCLPEPMPFLRAVWEEAVVAI